MRQAGVLAACGLYALRNHVKRLAEDHALAREIAGNLRHLLDQRFRVQEPETNIILVKTDSRDTTDMTLARWREKGILALALDNTTIRLVTHMDLPPAAASVFS